MTLAAPKVALASDNCGCHDGGNHGPTGVSAGGGGLGFDRSLAIGGLIGGAIGEPFGLTAGGAAVGAGVAVGADALVNNPPTYSAACMMLWVGG